MMVVISEFMLSINIIQAYYKLNSYSICFVPAMTGHSVALQIHRRENLRPEFDLEPSGCCVGVVLDDLVVSI